MIRTIWLLQLMRTMLMACALQCQAEVIIDSVHETIQSETQSQSPPHQLRPVTESSGQINLLSIENTMHYNPFSEDIDLARNWGLCFDSLFVPDDFHYGIFRSLIASDLKISADKKKILIHIHHLAKFSNGDAITSTDVIASLNHFTHKGPLDLQIPHHYHITMHALDSSRLEINAQTPMTLADVLFLMRLPISQAQSLTRMNHPVESGAYRLQELRANRYATLKKHKNYWASDLPARYGMFHFDKIKFIFVKSSMIGFEVFKRRMADYRWEPFFENYEQLRSIAKKDASLKLMAIPAKRPVPMAGLVFNQHRDVWKNLQMRRAINLAFNFDSLNANLFKHQYTRLNSFFTHTPYASSKQHVLPFDLVMADQTLSDQGWIAKGGVRVHQHTGDHLTMKILVNSLYNEKIATIFSKSLKDLGITTYIQRVDTADYLYRVQSGDFDLAYFHLSTAQTLPHIFAKQLVMSSVNTYQFGNLFGVRNTAVSDLLESLNRIDSFEHRIRIFHNIDNAMMDSLAVIPFWYPSYDRIAHWESISGPSIPMQSRPNDNFRYWWPSIH